MALRVALGAGRARIVRQVLTESVALALAAALVGLVVGAVALSIFKSLLPASIPGLAQASMDWQVMAAVTLLAFAVGIGFAAVSNSVPLQGQLPTIPVDLEDHPKTADHPSPMFWFGAVSAGYLRTMHTPLLAGRDSTNADGPNAAKVVLISQSTANRFWPDGNALGKHLKFPTAIGGRSSVSLPT